MVMYVSCETFLDLKEECRLRGLKFWRKTVVTETKVVWHVAGVKGRVAVVIYRETSRGYNSGS